MQTNVLRIKNKEHRININMTVIVSTVLYPPRLMGKKKHTSEIITNAYPQAMATLMGHKNFKAMMDQQSSVSVHVKKRNKSLY